MTPRHFTRSPRPARQAGFTLLEILVVLGLIVVVLSLVASNVFSNADKAKYKLAQAQVQMVAGKIDSYQQDTNALPVVLDNLVTQPGGVSGWLGPYARPADLKDPWGRNLEYRAPGQNGRFDLISYGADGKPGGESYNADIRFE